MTHADPGPQFQTALLHALGQAVIVTDPAGIVVAWNAAAQRTYGWSSEEMTGATVYLLVPEQSVERAREMHAKVLAGHTWKGDLLVSRRDGSTFPAIFTGAPVLDESGAVSGLIGLSSDATASRLAEHDAQTLLSVVTSTADAVFTKDLDGRVLTWNRGAEALYGYMADEVIGQHVGLLDPEPTAADAQSLLKAVAAGDTVRGLETVRRRRDGSLIDVSLTVSPIFGAHGEVVSASVIGRDISGRRELERQLAKQATYDDVTGLPNRALLEDRLQRAIARSARLKRPLAVLFVDLDRLGLVNATHGYDVGDQLLAEFAGRLHATIGPGDTVGRVGGDEFVILCEETDAEEAAQLAARLAVAVEAPVALPEITLSVSASIGIAVTPPLDGGRVLRYAQAALLEAKARGRGRSQVFDLDAVRGWTDRVDLGRDLREALRNDALEMHYQPVVELATGTLLGVEALVRWNHPTRGWVPPGLFVPLAEDIGLIADLDLWVLRRACREAGSFRRAGVLAETAYLAVNISALNTTEPAMVERVRDAASSAGLPLTALELEVTETGLMADRRAAGRVLSALRDLGVGLALDDFGMGYSSFTYLRQLPVTTIKIDREFVRHIVARADDLAITASVVDLGRAVGLRTIAEGIETQEQLAMLHRMGCVGGQGFLWSPALASQDLVTLLGAPEGLAAARTIDPVRHPSKRRPPVTNAHGLHRMLQLHREGASLATIAAALNAERYLSPTHQRWHGASVARVIADVAQAAQARALPPRT